MLDWLAQRAISRPGGIALVHGDRTWCYAELNELVAGMAGRLASAGVEPGDHVAVLMPNRVEYVCAIHALARLGAVLVPLNVRLTPHELRWQTDQADCTFLLCSRETQDQASSLRIADCGLRISSSQFTIRNSGGRRVLSVDPPRESGVEALEDYPAQVATFRAGRRLDLETVQGIVFTSGTTGRPKGAMLTYRNHLASATASAFRLGTLPEDRWLACLPLYHVGGLAIIWRCCLYGTTVVLQACPERSRRDGFDAAAANQALDTQAITLISLVPTMLHRVLEARGERPFPESLRCVLLGGAAAPLALLHRSLSLGVPVATTYGLTEAASQVATASPADVRRKTNNPSKSSRYCVGKPLMFSSVRIVGDDGEERPVGEIGEIAVSGPTVMKGYYNQPDASANVLRDGELYTGDMGYVDDDGDLWVVQRRFDLIVTGGENVYPAEVEEVLLEHPGVKAVCVVGVDDEEWGQRVAAAVVVAENATLTEDELISFCNARLAQYKRPRVLRFVSSIPQTPSGKVLRDAVAAVFSHHER
ncbi:MAG: o-succinylbenzoate--CoA ligase [Anaerolineae bacterium]